MPKVDSREVYGDEGDAICHPPVCECEGCSLPPPPDVIYAHGYMDDEQAAFYNSPTPPHQHSRGPDSCENYKHGCDCYRCEEREDWVNGGGR